jgi:hypothetical protein
MPVKGISMPWTIPLGSIRIEREVNNHADWIRYLEKWARHSIEYMDYLNSRINSLEKEVRELKKQNKKN